MDRGLCAAGHGWGGGLASEAGWARSPERVGGGSGPWALSRAAAGPASPLGCVRVQRVGEAREGQAARGQMAGPGHVTPLSAAAGHRYPSVSRSASNPPNATARSVPGAGHTHRTCPRAVWTIGATRDVHSGRVIQRCSPWRHSRRRKGSIHPCWMTTSARGALQTASRPSTFSALPALLQQALRLHPATKSQL